MQFREERGSNLQPPEGSKNAVEKPKSGKLKAVSAEEELKLLKYYASKIQGISKTLGFPDKVYATAQMFLKRAYLSFSCLDHNPQHILLACIYVAGKVEESYIGAEEFCRIMKSQEAIVLRGEIVLLEALHYDLIVYTPYRALEGFCSELEGWKSSSQQLTEEALKQARGKAHGAVDVLMLTDAPLQFSPGQLALAALRSALKSADLNFDAFMEHLVGKAGDSWSNPTTPEAEKLQTLKKALQQIDLLGVEGASPVNEHEVRKIDRKLKLCHNLLLDPSSKEFEQAEAAKAQQEHEARIRKAAAKKARVAASEAALLQLQRDSNGVLSIIEEPPAEDPLQKRARPSPDTDRLF